MRVLVGYASYYGSTKEIAERICARLRERDIEVDVRPMDSVEDVTVFDAVVLGSAIHGGAWLPPAVEFARSHLDPLSRRPLWLFSVSSVGEESSAFPGFMAAWMRQMTKRPRGMDQLWSALDAQDYHRFAGVVKPQHWGGTGGFFMKVMGGHYGDLRNWAEVEAWADSIARVLDGKTVAFA